MIEAGTIGCSDSWLIPPTVQTFPYYTGSFLLIWIEAIPDLRGPAEERCDNYHRVRLLSEPPRQTFAMTFPEDLEIRAVP